MDFAKQLLNTLINTSFVISLLGIIGYFIKDWLFEKLKVSLGKELENYKHDLQQLEIRRSEKWRIKRDACLEALTIADAVQSNLTWSNLDSSKIIKQEVDTLKFRDCYNKLVCSCDDAQVLDLFKEVCGLKKDKMKGDLMFDFRNIIRKELGFGEELDTDREITFFGWLPGEYRHKNTSTH